MANLVSQCIKAATPGQLHAQVLEVIRSQIGNVCRCSEFVDYCAACRVQISKMPVSNFARLGTIQFRSQESVRKLSDRQPPPSRRFTPGLQVIPLCQILLQGLVGVSPKVTELSPYFL